MCALADFLAFRRVLSLACLALLLPNPTPPPSARQSAACSHPTNQDWLSHADSGLRQGISTTPKMLSMSPTTPGTAGHQGLSYGNSPASTRSQGFKRQNDSDDDHDNGGHEPRTAKAARQAAVKRACNECRQQKVINSRRPLSYANSTCPKPLPVHPYIADSSSYSSVAMSNKTPFKRAHDAPSTNSHASSSPISSALANGVGMPRWRGRWQN